MPVVVLLLAHLRLPKESCIRQRGVCTGTVRRSARSLGHPGVSGVTVYRDCAVGKVEIVDRVEGHTARARNEVLTISSW